MDWLPFVGILVGLVSLGLALAKLILVTTQNTRAEIQALSGQVNNLSDRVGQLEQSQARMNEVLGTLSAGQDNLSDRVSQLEQSQARMNEVLGTLSAGQDKLSERVGRLEQSQARMNEVLGTLSAGQDKLSERVSRSEQSQAHTAGLIEGIRESLFDRVRRVGASERVAEDAESYDPQG